MKNSHIIGTIYATFENIELPFFFRKLISYVVQIFLRASGNKRISLEK